METMHMTGIVSELDWHARPEQPRVYARPFSRTDEQLLRERPVRHAAPTQRRMARQAAKAQHVPTMRGDRHDGLLCKDARVVVCAASLVVTYFATMLTLCTVLRFVGLV